jgi:hypothetical protein
MKPLVQSGLSTAALEPLAILKNTAEVKTTSPETKLENNKAVETTTLETDLDRVEPTGTLIIEKQTNPDGDKTSFSFTGNIGMTNNFSLADGETKTFSDVTPSSYTVSEIVPENWQSTSLSCNTSNASYDLATATINVDVAAGETIRCTFIRLYVYCARTSNSRFPHSQSGTNP